DCVKFRSWHPDGGAAALCRGGAADQKGAARARIRPGSAGRGTQQSSISVLTINRKDDNWYCMQTVGQIAALTREAEHDDTELLDRVFFALSDPVRRAMLERLRGGGLLVFGLGAPLCILLPAGAPRIHGVVGNRLGRRGRP